MNREQRMVNAAVLADQLRAWLRAQGQAAPEVIAASLAYELAALLARYAASEAQAHLAIDGWAVAMHQQIQALGVGVEHP